MNQRQRVAIVGAGISGLSAAWNLGKSDPSVEITVLEASDQLGGVLQTEHTDGYCMELGPDSMLSRLPSGLEMCERLGMSDQLINTSDSQRGVYVVCRGRLQRVPEGLAVMAPQSVWPMVTTPILSWGGKLRLAGERLIPRRKSPDDESLSEFSRRRLGNEMFQRLVQPLAGGIYMGDPEQLSIQATFPQFVEMETKFGSLIKASRAGRAAGEAKSEGGPRYSLFVSPRRGLASMIDALAAQLGDCRILRRQQVDSLSLHDGRWLVEVTDQNTGQSRQEEFAGVILAVPAHHAALMLQRAEPRLSQLLQSIPFAGCVVVNLAYDREAIAHPLDAFGFVVPHTEKRPVLACTFSSVKYAERAPAGKVLVRGFLGGACFPEAMEWSDEQLVQTVHDELNQLLGISRSPLMSRITHWRRSMPQYNLGHLQRVEQIEGQVESLHGLELAGNSYRGVGIPHCIRSGQQASDRLASALRQEANT